MVVSDSVEGMHGHPDQQVYQPQNAYEGDDSMQGWHSIHGEGTVDCACTCERTLSTRGSTADRTWRYTCSKVASAVQYSAGCAQRRALPMGTLVQGGDRVARCATHKGAACHPQKRKNHANPEKKGPERSEKLARGSTKSNLSCSSASSSTAPPRNGRFTSYTSQADTLAGKGTPCTMRT